MLSAKKKPVRITIVGVLVSDHPLNNNPSFVFAMSHPYRVQFRRDVPPRAARTFSALALGWYVLRLQRFRRFAARDAECLALFAGSCHAAGCQPLSDTPSPGAEEPPGGGAAFHVRIFVAWGFGGGTLR